MTATPTHHASPEGAKAAANAVLSVRHLTTSFRAEGGTVTAVDDVSFDLAPGETLGIVGESGCGKTVTSKSIMRLLPEHITRYGPRSEVQFDGQNLIRASKNEMRKVRGNRIAMIFQEPMTSLNPVFQIGWQLDEALKYHTKMNKRERRDRAIEMLRLVEIPNPERRITEYPHQLSGGMRQRVMIAMALCCEPEILIADEPTTALDVTIQAQILDLMNSLKEKVGTAIMLITHDLGVVATVCDRVLVMYAGRVIEEGPVGKIFHEARHPYTRALLESIPKRGRKVPGAKLPSIPGIVPSLRELPVGCRFEARCRYSDGTKCVRDEPELTPTVDGRPVRCHYPMGTPAERKPHEVHGEPG
ncbi:MAG: ABC transporter ATP-binding protein [Phycisphaeraceae bacterium]|nr:MAG: ABC transporter ATP-binding protein [Phycisphaeraceae bacterium]